MQVKCRRWIYFAPPDESIVHGFYQYFEIDILRGNWTEEKFKI